MSSRQTPKPFAGAMIATRTTRLPATGRDGAAPLYFPVRRPRPTFSRRAIVKTWRQHDRAIPCGLRRGDSELASRYDRRSGPMIADDYVHQPPKRKDLSNARSPFLADAERQESHDPTRG